MIYVEKVDQLLSKQLAWASDMANMDVGRQHQILFIEDDLQLAAILKRSLEQNGFAVTHFSEGADAIAHCRTNSPEIVLLDYDLPDLSGPNVCKQIRTLSSAYVVMLTGRSAESDIVMSLELGADDYITKPFSFNELIARLHSMLRRPRTTARKTVETIGSLKVDSNTRFVSRNEASIELTRIEFDLLQCFIRDPGALVSRQYLMREVWSLDFECDDHLIDVHMYKLRQKLAKVGVPKESISAVRGSGFRFVSEVVTSAD